MNRRSLIALVISLAVLGAMAVAVSLSQRPVSGSGGLFLPGMKEELNAVSKIVVRKAGDKTVATLERQKDSWVVAERDNYPADVARIRRDLIALAEARVLEEKTANPDLYPRLKVEDIGAESATGVRLDITAGDRTTGVIIGTTGVSGGERTYARRADESKSWLISGNIEAPRETIEWLDRVITDIPGKRVQSASITQPDGSVLRLEKASADEANFQVPGLPKGRELQFPGVGNTVGGALADLRLDSVTPAAGFKPGDVKPTVARFTTFDGLVIEVRSWKLEQGLRLRFSATADKALADKFAPKAAAGPGEDATAPEPAPDFAAVQAEAARLQARLGGWVYTVPEFKSEQLTRKLEQLLAAKN